MFRQSWYFSGDTILPPSLCTLLVALFDTIGAQCDSLIRKYTILVYNSNKMHKSQSLFNLTTVLHVSGVTMTHIQEHKTTVTTASGNHYTVLLSAAIVEELELI